MTKALVVLSGGQDSTTCLFWALQAFDEVHTLTFDYSQRHSLEIEAATEVAEMAGVVSHEVIRLGPVLGGLSPLTNPDQDLEQYDDYEAMDEIIGDRVELTFVPLRNAFFLTLAANRAVIKGCTNLVTGICGSDLANYPDCRSSFISAQEATINEALGTDDFQIHTPLSELDKKGIIELGQSLEGCWEALAYTHTCYAGVYPPCGRCHSCVLREEGFRDAGAVDPLLERAAL
jgi:7-cyano-7-deazaguanine synthase